MAVVTLLTVVGPAVDVTSARGATAPPVITGVSPNVGSTAGGNVVTISGSGFTATTTVTFRTDPGTTVTVGGTTTLTVTVPTVTTAGPVTVTVTTTNGTSAGSVYTYVGVPTIATISPDAGSTAGTTAVTIVGTGFTPTTAVDFGTQPGGAVTVTGTTTLTVTALSL